jgi:hypothetical protein
VTAWLGFKVTGKLPPETEKPAPLIVAALTVTAAVPLEVSVTDFETVEFTATLPKDMLVVLTLNMGVAAFSCRLNFCDTPPSAAVNVAACALLTNATLAVKLTLFAPDGTFTEIGTETERLVLDKLTLTPPLGAAPLSVTMHASEPDPVMDELLQERPFSETAPAPDLPFPWSFTAAAGAVEDVDEGLVRIFNCPVMSDAAVGSKCTFRFKVLPDAREIGKLLCPIREKD